MKIKGFFFLLFIFSCSHVIAQRYITQAGTVSFFSAAPVENIKAETADVTSIFISDDGTIAFSVPIKGFQFEKKLMQEHFNDKYMESDRYPRSTFSGVITGFNMNTTNLQSVRAKGKLTIHGITKPIDVPGTLEVKNGLVYMKSKFKVKTADYGITIPTLLWKNISEEIEITIDLTYKKQ